MTPVELARWEPRFAAFLDETMAGDAAHDREHVVRVVSTARRLTQLESAEPAIVIPAAWLHDCVTVPKQSAQRARASRLAARTAAVFLGRHAYPEPYIGPIMHAIEAHSFSADIPPRTLEAQIVQDADRLDALGAVGIARCILSGAAMGSRLYDPDDPFPTDRPLDDRINMVDHFYAKLLRLAGAMNTRAGRAEAEQRTAYMRGYLDQLAREVTR